MPPVIPTNREKRSARHSLLDAVDKHKEKLPDAAYKEIVEKIAALTLPIEYEIVYLEQHVTGEQDEDSPDISIHHNSLRKKVCTLKSFVDLILMCDAMGEEKKDRLLASMERYADTDELRTTGNRPCPSFCKPISVRPGESVFAVHTLLTIKLV